MNTQNKPHKLSLNQETLRTLTTSKRPQMTFVTCEVSLCVQTPCPAQITKGLNC